MHEYNEFVDEMTDEVENAEEETREELLEEDEISSREEAFLKGYEDAAEDDEDYDESREEE